MTYDLNGVKPKSIDTFYLRTRINPKQMVFSAVRTRLLSAY